MSLSKRQAEAINKIILEEVQGAMKGRKLREEYTQRAALVEYGPGNMEDRVDDRYNTDTLVHEVETTLGDSLYDAFSDDIYKLTQKVHRRYVSELFKLTQKHNMGVSSPAEVGSLLSSDDNADVQDAEYEFWNDINSVISDYGKKLAKSLIKTAKASEGGEE